MKAGRDMAELQTLVIASTSKQSMAWPEEEKKKQKVDVGGERAAEVVHQQLFRKLIVISFNLLSWPFF